jgi:glycosyltransferase involved in cell wall biosynthesis
VTLLYFADTRFPIERANGAQTMATCHALAERGHAVRLVVRPDTAAPARDPLVFYDLPPVEQLTVTTIPSAQRPRASRIRFLLGAVALVRAHPGAIVYTRDLGVAAFLLQVPARRRPRVIYESHGIAPVVSAELPVLLGSARRPSPTKLRRLDRRERWVWTRAAASVVITHALGADLAGRYGPRERVFVVPDGAREPAGLNGRLDRLPEQPLAAYAGHLYPWKGVDVFVRALAAAPRVRGLIVGGHPGERDLSRVEALVATLGLRDRVEITGLVPAADVARRLAAASMLVLPNTASTVSERYTSPLKLFEYLWLGRPIVASDLASIREVLHDGQTALLVPPGDPGALAAAMNRLAGHPTLAAALGRAARELAPNFTWSARAARLEPALAAAGS